MPQAHDLLLDAVNRPGGTCLHVVITASPGTTHSAKVVLNHAGRQLELDAHPSDAVNVAIRAKAPMFAEESLLVEARETSRIDSGSDGVEGEAAQWTG